MLLASLSPCALAQSFQQSTGAGNLVSIEAENHSGNIARSNRAWSFVQSPTGFSGSGAMAALPNKRSVISSGYATLSPEMQFSVNFVVAGRHYIRLRGRGANGGDDSLHLGLNGQQVLSSQAMGLVQGSAWGWTGNGHYIDIPSAGMHTINVWMREDGAHIDKIVLTTDSAYVASGTGPPESPLGGSNGIPDARDDAVQAEQNSTANVFAVLSDNGSGADTDPNGDTLTITAVSTPNQGGSAAIAGAGTTVSYTPANGFAGTETFTYTLSDGKGGSDTATVTVTVTATNAPPDAQNDAFQVQQNSSGNTLTVMADNGSGADTDPNGDTLTITAVSTPNQGGSAAIAGAGTTISYTPANGFAGTETFTYTVSDGKGGSGTATVTVTVSLVGGGGTTPPVAYDDVVQIDRNSSGNVIAVLDNNVNGPDADADGDPISVIALGATSHGGSASIAPSGQQILYSPAPGFAGIETFSYTIGDGKGNSDVGMVSAYVTEDISAPIDAAPPFLQSSAAGNVVSLEVENYHLKIARGSRDWTLAQSPSGYSGTGAMAALPNSGSVVSTGFTTSAAEMQFRVNFVTSGRHYVRVRARGNHGGDDSFHLGLNGVATTSSTAIGIVQGSSYGWTGNGFYIDVPSAGVHTVHVWMREDGAYIDKLVLTTNSSYVASGLGPQESGRATACTDYPAVDILSPKTLDVQPSPTLVVHTLTCLNPTTHAGWGVKVILDGAQELYEFNPPYQVQFENVSQTEHSLSAYLVDANGNYQPSLHAVDSQQRVGIGDYYVAMGDSITSGTNDDDPSDNLSADGRNNGPGYPSILNNLLTAARGYPHTVENVAVGGTTSAWGLSNLPSFLAANPNANYFIVLYGMNDARPWLPVPSGLGLSPGQAGYAGSYKDNLQRIINLVNGAGKRVVLGKIPIALGDSVDTTPYPDPDQGARSLLIQQYNLVIDELRANPANLLEFVPPDFYAYFRENHPTEYSDNIHPNEIGYRSMGNLWLQAITQ